MATTVSYERIAWDNRFEEPNITDLRAALDGAVAELFDSMRDRLLAISGVSEKPMWNGPCWRWTLAYVRRGDAEPIAYIIPSPTDLQLAIPMEQEFVKSVYGRQMKRTIRDGIEMVLEPFQSRHGVWSIVSPGLIEDLTDLVNQKLDTQS